MIEYKIEQGWFTFIEGVTLDKDERKKDLVALGKDPVLVWHTTESDNPARGYEFPPHGEVFKKKFRQLVPLDKRASALVGQSKGGGPYDPNEFAVQFEIVGWSKQALWMPDAETTETLARVSAAVCDHYDIPRRVPNEAWKDDLSDIKTSLSSDNTRRQWAKEPAGAALRRFPAERGIWYHMEVPWQGNVHPPPPPSWHWDCGAMRRTKIIELVEGHMGLTEPDRKILAKWLGLGANDDALEFVGDAAVTIKQLAKHEIATTPSDPIKAAVFGYFDDQQKRIAALEAAVAALMGRGGTRTPDPTATRTPDTTGTRGTDSPAGTRGLAPSDAEEGPVTE